MNSLVKNSGQSKYLRILAMMLLIATAALALASCGSSEEEKEGITEGEPVALGPLEYNVLFTRPLNIDDVEDAEYLVGQPDPKPGFTYIGVFVKVKNTDENESHTLPTSFELVDTKESVFKNIKSESIYALTPGQEVGPEDDVPAADSTPQVGPIQGSMLLFLMDDPAIENRPVQLVINGEDGPATVDVDL